MSTLLLLLLIVASALGFADAGYITYEEFANIPSVCQTIPGFDCGTVLSSPWAHIGPVPVSVLGMLFYASVFVVAVYHLVILKPRPIITTFLYLLAMSGFGFTLFLLYLQAFIIGAYCLYCMISAVTSTCIFLITGAYWWNQKQIKNMRIESDDIATE